MEKTHNTLGQIIQTEMQEHNFLNQVINVMLMTIMYICSKLSVSFFKILQRDEALMYTRITFVIFILINYMKIIRALTGFASECVIAFNYIKSKFKNK